MDLLQALWLGMAQGLTEFLPVSSSGHLMLLERIFGLAPSEAFVVLLHVGTLISVIAVFWRRILNMLIAFFKAPLHCLRHPSESELVLLVIATIPTVIVAVLFHGYFTDAFKLQFLGYAFLVTTLILWLGDLVSGMAFHAREVKWHTAIVMGLMQAVAIMPGISRSGATISGGISAGLSRKRAADFSFLMSLPAILGAVVFDFREIMELPKLASGPEGIMPLLVGVVASAVFGFIAIKFMLGVVRRVRLPWFGIYTGVLGILIILDQYVFHMYF